VKPWHLTLMLLVNLAWGINVVPMKLSLEYLPPITATLLRFVFLLVLCAPALRWLPGRMMPVLLIGLIGGVFLFSLNMIAFSQVEDISALAIAGQLGVPFSLLLAIGFLRERIRIWRTFGIMLSFVGVLILSFDPRILDQWAALVLCVAASFCYAVATILMRQLRGVGPLQLQGWIAAVSLVPMLALSMFYEPGALASLPDLPPEPFGYLLFTAAASSIIGHGGMYWLLQRYPVSVTAPYTLLSPLLSVGFCVWLLDNQLTGQMVLGGIVTLAGVAIITIRSARRGPAGEGQSQ
jgi:O-acetylserine/cysteine efflux transporter